MQTVNQIISILVTIIATGCVARIIGYALMVMMNPDEKSNLTKKIKNMVVLAVITVLVGSYSIINVIKGYY